MKMTKGISEVNRAAEKLSETASSLNQSGIERHVKLLKANIERKKATGNKDEQVDNLTWKHLRAGIRVRTIMNSKRMHEVKCKVQNVEQKKLVITR